MAGLVAGLVAQPRALFGYINLLDCSNLVYLEVKLLPRGLLDEFDAIAAVIGEMAEEGLLGHLQGCPREKGRERKMD